jgi:hypothetical protein
MTESSTLPRAKHHCYHCNAPVIFKWVNDKWLRHERRSGKLHVCNRQYHLRPLKSSTTANSNYKGLYS